MDETSALDVLAGAKPGEIEVIAVLTDEQIVVLDGTEQPTLLPWHTEQPGSQTRLHTATRGLVASGLILPDHDGESTRINPSLDALFKIRKSTPTMLVVERQTADSKRWSYTYLFKTTSLEEQVSADGFHTFVAVRTADLGSHLAGLLDPLGTAAKQEIITQFADIADFEHLASPIPEVAESVAISTLTLIDTHADLARVIVVYASPQGAAALLGGPNTGTDDYVLKRVSRDGLAAIVNASVAQVQLPDLGQ